MYFRCWAEDAECYPYQGLLQGFFVAAKNRCMGMNASVHLSLNIAHFFLLQSAVFNAELICTLQFPGQPGQTFELCTSPSCVQHCTSLPIVCIFSPTGKPTKPSPGPTHHFPTSMTLHAPDLLVLQGALIPTGTIQLPMEIAHLLLAAPCQVLQCLLPLIGPFWHRNSDLS